MKQARPDSIGSVFAKKESAFEGAKALLIKTGHDASIKTGAELFYATAFALERGLDPSSLNEVLITGKGNTSQQISAVIELGETLNCAGMTPDILLLIMKDCLLKKLDAGQIKRVTQHVKERLLRGLNHKIIRDELWIQAALEGIREAV